jgi:hypothetical protein
MKSENASAVLEYAISLAAAVPPDERGVRKSRILIMWSGAAKTRRVCRNALVQSALDAELKMGGIPTYESFTIAHKDMQVELVVRHLAPTVEDIPASLRGADFTAAIIDYHAFAGTCVEEYVLFRCGRYPSVEACREGKVMTLILTDKLQ